MCIPHDAGHPFHAIVVSDSTRSRSPIQGDPGRFVSLAGATQDNPLPSAFLVEKKGRRVAAGFAEQALRNWSFGTDFWQEIFELADASARAIEESDLVPYWIASGPFRVQRHVPLLHCLREVDVFRRLKRPLAAYRVVFGQPRQEVLMTLLDESEVDTRQLGKWAIDLKPQP